MRRYNGHDLDEVGLIMFVFGLGAALPLRALGVLSREAMLRWRHRLASAGAVSVATGVFVLTRLDKS